jgi:two-component system, OmpR family, response regulator VanR
VVRALVVEDEPVLAEAVRDGLRLAGVAADIAPDGEAAMYAVAHTAYDIVLLDRDLPRMHGDDVCRALVERPDRPAILMLTAAATVDERIDGLDLGADDYLTKPFELRELIARVRALGRRAGTPVPPILRRRDLVLNPARWEVTRAGRRIPLTPKEFAVLELLVRADGAVISAEVLLEKAWDERADPMSQTVKVTISNIRRKCGEPWVIRTVRGVGYAVV